MADGVMGVSKGPGFTIQFSQVVPGGGVVYAELPLPEAARLVEAVGRMIAEQIEAQQSEMAKWVRSG